MTIIEIKSSNGLHRIESQSHRRAVWLPGYIEVPAHLESAVWACCGYCDLTIEDGKLTALTPTERPPEPEPEPTPEEQLRADVDYLAALQGVSL